MKQTHIPERIELTLRKLRKHRWPVHIVAQASKVSIEANEILKYSDTMKYSTGGNLRQLEESAYRTIATAIIFIENLKHDKDTITNQHHGGGIIQPFNAAGSFGTSDGSEWFPGENFRTEDPAQPADSVHGEELHQQIQSETAVPGALHTAGEHGTSEGNLPPGEQV